MEIKKFFLKTLAFVFTIVPVGTKVGTRKVLAACGADEVETGLGCIPTNTGGLTNWVVGSATKIGGGIAFALLIYGGIQLINAGGDPERVERAKRIITRALVGALVLFFTVLIIRVIGYDILQLPGWKESGGSLQLPE